MNDDIELKEIAETEDTNDPIFEARLASGSYVNFGFFEESEGIRIFHVKSQNEGDMAHLMENIVQHFGEDRIEMYNVISRQLKERLHGFEEQEEIVQTHMGPQKVTVLRGRWETDENE